jgi:hypothetical protein
LYAISGDSERKTRAMDHLSVTVACYVLSAVVTACTTAIGVFINRLLRVLNIFRDFPPHAHIGEDIFYPEGVDAPNVHKLFPKARGASSGSD